MKKSTLITTIAMIVVVVVALSTATYAWFSAASTNKVSATVTTVGSGDFAISQAVVADPNADSGVAALSNWSIAAEAITIDTSLMHGLYAPTAELTAANYGIASASATKNTGKFYNAQSADSNATATILADATYFKPVVLRVQNTSGANKQLKAHVDINVGSGANSANVFAGEAISFVMIVQDADFATVATVTSGYGFGGTLSPTGTPNFVQDEVVKSPSSATTTGYTRMSYDGLTSSVAAAAAAAEDQDTGAAIGDYVNTQDVTLSTNLQNSGIVYVTLYLWIDGWRADNSAAGADDLSVGFRLFGDAVAQNQNP